MKARFYTGDVIVVFMRGTNLQMVHIL